MAIESKNLLVWVKSMSRGQNLPLDASEIYDSYSAAETYASSAIAYGGQTIKALLDDGKYHEYILQPSDAGYVLEECGGSTTYSKQYVMVVEELPDSGQEEGILYINTTDSTGSIWNGSEWKQVFYDTQTVITEIQSDISTLQSDVQTKAPIDSPTFTGTVTIDGSEIALKNYVDSLFAQIQESSVPGIVDSSNPIPTDYKAGNTYRVAESGTYAGAQCEVGDLILVINDYASDTASDNDFIVLQANIDGAVTSSADTTTVGEIVVFDSVTGKVIKGSSVSIDSLNSAIEKSHEHSNKTQLDTYDKTQSELLDSAKTEAKGLVDTLESSINTLLESKADKGTTLSDYGITDAYTKTEIDTSISTITDNLNTKISISDAETKIATAKSETLTEAAENASTALEARIGSIPTDTTIKSYIDTAVGSGGTSSAEAIATAKQEAIDTSKAYTDEQISSALEITEF